MSSVKKRLREVYEKSPRIPFDENSKFILMSDCHRGQGNTADNFLPNQTLFFGALQHYYEEGFTYIELGDGDELWENRNMQSIIDVHSDAFWLISQFYMEDRFYMLYGNHDIVKKKKNYMKKNCYRYFPEGTNECEPLFESITASEGLLLENQKLDLNILLVHGHQGSLLNDTFWPLARFLVRYVWGPLELVGFRTPTGAGRPRSQRERIEKKFSDFARDENQMVIAGHTHRPIFPDPGTGLYFNDGSCVHPRCITGVEIEKEEISLVKWAVFTRPDETLYVGRQVLKGPVSLTEFI